MTERNHIFVDTSILRNDKIKHTLLKQMFYTVDITNDKVSVVK